MPIGLLRPDTETSSFSLRSRGAKPSIALYGAARAPQGTASLAEVCARLTHYTLDATKRGAFPMICCAAEGARSYVMNRRLGTGCPRESGQNGTMPVLGRWKADRRGCRRRPSVVFCPSVCYSWAPVHSFRNAPEQSPSG